MQSCTRDIADAEQRSRIPCHSDIAYLCVMDICQDDTFAAGACNVGERKSFQRLVGMNAGSIDQYGNIRDSDIAEAEVPDGGNSFISRDWELILQTAIEDVEAEEARLRAGDIEIVHIDVLDERAASWAALDVDGEGPRAGAFAVFDMDIADAA